MAPNTGTHIYHFFFHTLFMKIENNGKQRTISVVAGACALFRGEEKINYRMFLT